MLLENSQFIKIFRQTINTGNNQKCTYFPKKWDLIQLLECLKLVFSPIKHFYVTTLSLQLLWHIERSELENLNFSLNGSYR